MKPSDTTARRGSPGTNNLLGGFMPSDETQIELPLNRKEAAKYISGRWFKISWLTLADLARKGRGPDYMRTASAGGRSLYMKAELDDWARRKRLNPKTLEPIANGALAAAASR